MTINHLYMTEHQTVTRIVRRVLSPTYTAATDDVTQIVWLEVCERMADGREVTPSLVRRIAQDAALRYRRDRSYRAKIDAVEIDALDQPDTCPWLVSRSGTDPDQYSQMSAIMQTIDSLTADDRAILMAHYVDGRSLSDIARSLGITHAAARQRISRARARLASLLGHSVNTTQIMAA